MARDGGDVGSTAAADAGEVLRATGLTKLYRQGGDTIQALCGVDLTLRHGAVFALTGPSGSGKSSLLNIIGLLDAPNEGTLELDGRRVDFADEAGNEKLRSQCLGFVFQTFNLTPVLSALENVELPLLLSPLTRRERLERAEEMLDAVGLTDRRHHRPRELSGGQQQRVAIARALVADPLLVLADEPTANLDSQTAFALLDLFLELNAVHGTTLLFSTHDRRLLDHVHSVRVLQDGRIVS